MKNKGNISWGNIDFKGQSKIYDAMRGVHINQTLRAAVKLDLFTLLAEKPLTVEEIKDCLGLHGRGLPDFLDTLVSLELLERDGNGINARYQNTDEVSLFLVKGSPQYIGWSFEHRMQVFEQSWSALADALKTGKPVRQDIKESGKSLFEINYQTDEGARTFVEGMNFGQFASFTDFARNFDFSGYHTLCDIGGANGLLAILVAQLHSHMKCLTFDLPALGPYALKKIEEAGFSDRISVVSGNFFEDHFPSAEIITMGNILHDWNLEQKKLLIAKAYDALPDGGLLVVIENIIDNGRRKNTGGLLMAVQMLLITEGGFDFTAADFDSWAREAGFKKTSYMHLEGNSSAVIAYK
ncbi:MAG: acetylserotonin O-methyltransferase [Acidobacteria bacterium]|jgi:hypothetical protein|nr:acetylserotonin O-methyltransferase [Acidobacteriota bacterium]